MQDARTILEKLTREYAGKFVLAKIDVSKNSATADEYEIRSISCVKLFKDGEVVDEFIGTLPEDKIKSWLEKNI